MESLFATFDLSITFQMSKISKSFQALGLLFRNPWLLNKVLDDERFWGKK